MHMYIHVAHIGSYDFWVFYLFFNLCCLEPRKILSPFTVKAGKKSVRVVHLICCFQHTLCLCPCSSWRIGLVLYLCSMQICPLLYGFKSYVATDSWWTNSLSNCVLLLDGFHSGCFSLRIVVLCSLSPTNRSGDTRFARCCPAFLVPSE